MAEGKYCRVSDAIKQITSEYCREGDAIKQITINAPRISDAIKQISVGEKQIWACEQGSDRLYGIDDDYAILAGWPVYGGTIADPAAVACDDEGNTYWACANNVYKYNLAGALQWTYSGHTAPVVSICLQREGSTYLYTGDAGGTVKRLIDAGSVAGEMWSKTPYVGTVFGLAVDVNNNQLYAAYGIGGVGRVVRFLTSNGNYANIYYNATANFFSIAIDEGTPSLYIGDNAGYIRKISTAGYAYWTQDKLGEIYSIAADGSYGYFANGSRGDVGKFALATGTNVWLDQPAGTSYGVAVDAFGNVYSTHGAFGSVNAVVRKNNSSGVEQWTWQPYVNSTWKGIAVGPGLKAAGF